MRPNRAVKRSDSIEANGFTAVVGNQNYDKGVMEVKRGKLFSIITVILLIGALFTACSESSKTKSVQSTGKTEPQMTKAPDNLNATDYPIVKKPITLKMMGISNSMQAPWDKMVIFQDLEKKTNIHFEFSNAPAASFQEKKNLAFASNDLPDIFFGADIEVPDQVNYGSQGALIPLEKLIDQYAPNIKKLLEDRPEIRKTITASDGHIYALPSINDEPRGRMPKVWINSDWMNALKLQMPNSTDELYNILKAFKDKDPNGNSKPDEIPLTFYSKEGLNGLRFGLLANFGLLDSRIGAKDDKVYYAPMRDEYKQYLTFMNKLFKEKLIDQEAFTQTTQQMTAKGNAGTLGVFEGAAPFLVVKMDDNTKYLSLPPLTSPTNSQKQWPINSGIRTGEFAITKNNKFPEATMRWVDYFYSDEGGRYMFIGPEGMAWNWDSSKTTWTKTTAPSPFKNPEEYRGSITPNMGTMTPGVVPNSFMSKFGFPPAQHIIGQVQKNYVPNIKLQFPTVFLTPDEQSKVNAVITDIQTYAEQMEAKFIIGNEPISNWDNYIGTLKKMGIENVVNIYQVAYDKWKSSKN